MSCLKYKPQANNRPHYSPNAQHMENRARSYFPEVWASAPASIHTFPSLPIQVPLSNGKPLIVTPVLKHWWQLKGIVLRPCLRRLIAIQRPAGPSEPGVTNTSLLLTNSLINANFLVDGRAVIPLTNYSLVMAPGVVRALHHLGLCYLRFSRGQGRCGCLHAHSCITLVGWTQYWTPLRGIIQVMCDTQTRNRVIYPMRDCEIQKPAIWQRDMVVCDWLHTI